MSGSRSDRSSDGPQPVEIEIETEGLYFYTER